MTKPLNKKELNSLSMKAAMMSDGAYKSGPGVTGFFRKRINGTDGFAAAVYSSEDWIPGQQRPFRVLAFRGTDDMKHDILSDLYMAPTLNSVLIKRALSPLLKEYGVQGNIRKVVEQVPKWIKSFRIVRRLKINSPPPLQTQQAKALYDREIGSGPIDLVTGHSLGGALAKIVTLERGVPCIAFNSPCLGAMKSLPKLHAYLVHSINTNLDPLSYITKRLASMSNGTCLICALGSESTFGGIKPPKQRIDLAAAMLTGTIEQPYSNLINMAWHYHSISTLVRSFKANYPIAAAKCDTVVRALIETFEKKRAVNGSASTGTRSADRRRVDSVGPPEPRGPMEVHGPPEKRHRGSVARVR